MSKIDVTNDIYGAASFTASDLLIDDTGKCVLFSFLRVKVVAATAGANDADWRIESTRR